MLIWQEWTTKNKLNQLKKMNTKNMNTITTTQNIFMMRRFLMTKILIMKTYMG